MRTKHLRLTLALAAALGAATPWATAQTTPAPAADAKPPIADFFRQSQMSRPILSPDGKFIATVVRGKDENGVLAVIEIDNPRNVKVIAGFGDAGIGQFAWVTEQRLVYSAGATDKGNERQLHGSGLWSVNRDGSDVRHLIHARFGQQGETGSRTAARALDPDWGFRGLISDGTSDVLVGNLRTNMRGEVENVRLARLNVENGIRRFIDEGAPPNTMGWATDVNGKPWGLVVQRDDRVATYVKDSDDKWVVLQEGTQTDPPVSPAISDGKGLQLISARINSDEASLYRMDPVTRKIDKQPLVSAKGYDINPSPIIDRATKQILGLEYDTDAPGTVWFHPKLKEWQAKVDKQLPGRVNVLQCGACLTNSRLLVTSVSDMNPGEFYLYDGESDKLSALGASRPWIKPSQMAQRDMVRIKARDGLEFPVVVTTPRGKAAGPRPAVVLVHGGPWVKGTSWLWSPAAQFLASRGYVVIEPEFRGSEGYGYKLFRAGWKQWGLAMQDDVSDSLKWAVSKGWVDPQRVCIAGASYGGYATLMGMIKDPDQYKCGISWVGVTDIDLLFDIHWSDSSDSSKKYGMKELVGDQKADAEQFRKTSPVKRAAELKQPLLLAYGASDVRVPLKHGTDFKGAVESAGNKNVEWVVYSDEGHGWVKLSSNEDFWGRVEKLLAKTIGTAPSAAATPAPAPATGQ